VLHARRELSPGSVEAGLTPGRYVRADRFLSASRVRGSTVVVLSWRVTRVLPRGGSTFPTPRHFLSPSYSELNSWKTKMVRKKFAFEIIICIYTINKNDRHGKSILRTCIKEIPPVR